MTVLSLLSEKGKMQEENFFHPCRKKCHPPDSAGGRETEPEMSLFLGLHCRRLMQVIELPAPKNGKPCSDGGLGTSSRQAR